MTFNYFAYGSNMLTARLHDRCPSARLVGKATVDGYAIEFNKPGRDDSGKATLNRKTDGLSTGVVFEIEEEDLCRLDQAEGSGYRRDDNFVVHLADGREVLTSCYLARKTETGLRPYDWYLALVVAGARKHGLEDGYVLQLSQVAFDVDDELNRKTRLKALDALAESRTFNYRKLLSGRG